MAMHARPRGCPGLLLLWLLPLVLMPSICVHAEAHSHRLFRDLFKNYNKLLRPVRSEETVVPVKVNLDLVFFLQLDERQQQLSAVYWIQTLWRDELLTWDPQDYGNVTELELPASVVWRPDLVISNAVHGRGFKADDDVMLVVHNDGTVKWYVDERAVTFCPIDVTKFPFDTQICSIQIWQWSTLSHKVNLTGTDERLLPETRSSNGEFVVKDVRVHNEDEENEVARLQTRIDFYVTLERQRTYHIVTAIVPVVMLSVLNLFVFFLPEGGGERLGVCVSLLLSYAVYASALHDSLPETSSTVCVFVLYLTVMLGLKALTTVTCVLLAFRRNRKRGQAQEVGRGGHSEDRKQPADEKEAEGKDGMVAEDRNGNVKLTRKEGTTESEDLMFFLLFLALFVTVNVASFAYIVA